MKKGLKIFALGVAVLGLGCIGLAGCGTGGSTVSADEFSTFYEAATNTIASTTSYTFHYENNYSKVVDGQFDYIDEDTYHVKMTITEDSVTETFYYDGTYWYYESEDGNTKIKNVDDYDYGQVGNYTTAIGKCNTASYYVSTVLGTGSSAYTAYTTIKLSKTDSTSTYTINTSTGSYQLKSVLTYETDANGNSQVVSMRCETTQAGSTVNRSIAKTSTSITFPTDLESWSEASVE